MNTKSKITIEFTPIEAERLANYIKSNKGKYIQVFRTLGVGIGEYTNISTDETDELTDITDYDSF